MKKIMSRQISHNAGTFQHGVGMVEVLVAILLLAIGVLGYAAMQVRAVEATSEALTRSQAMILLRGLAENIRVMDTVSDQNAYTSKVHGYASITALPTAPKNCVTSTSCSAAEVADFDAYQTAYAAFNQGMRVDMYACPLTAATPSSSGTPAVPATNVSRQCLVAAWGKTTPTVGTAATDCLTSTGSYLPTSTCIMLEAY
jgi:type IV pilus assembly protein PilV